MDLLKEIRDDKFPKNQSDIKLRETVRVILFDNEGLVPTLFVSKENYHKLPGGGIEEGESKTQALAREVLEETGCAITVTGEVGKILEYRSGANFNWKCDYKQISYCYVGDVVSKVDNPNFDQGELKEGFELVWLPIKEAITTLENDKPKNYEGSFIQQRDLAFLKKFESIKESKHS